MATKAADLYDQDFYAWTQQQAAALRPHFMGEDRLDVEPLAEEVEDLGGSELHAVAELEALCERARRPAACSLHQREPGFVRRLPKRRPYERSAIRHRDVVAEAGIDIFGDDAERPQRTRRRKRGA